MSSISLQNISKKFAEKSILDGFNLEIERSGLILLKGDSGSGKTTLLNIIGGVEQVDSGKISIDGQDINELKPKQRTLFYRQKISFIFQGFYLHPNLNLSDNISLAGVFAKIPKAKRQKRVDTLADFLQIKDVLKSLPNQVSGGQAERACVARALFTNPEIILVDEPTNNLDDKNANSIIAMLSTLSKKLGKIIVVSSHDKRFEEQADRILTLKNGVLHEDN